MGVLKNIPQEVDYSKAKQRAEEEMEQINAKKDRLLELSMAGALNMTEFKTRNDSFNEQLKGLELRLATIKAEEEKNKGAEFDEAEIRKVLSRELSFEGEVNSALVASILEKVVVKKESTRKRAILSIRLKL